MEKDIRVAAGNLSSSDQFLFHQGDHDGRETKPLRCLVYLCIHWEGTRGPAFIASRSNYIQSS